MALTGIYLLRRQGKIFFCARLCIAIKLFLRRRSPRVRFVCCNRGTLVRLNCLLSFNIACDDTGKRVIHFLLFLLFQIIKVTVAIIAATIIKRI